MTSPIHVVIPVFNGWEQTRRCLDALRNCGYPALRILVVDHGSTDETPVALPRDYPEVVRIGGDESMWWSAATNLGIRAALADGAQTIMLLNNDCYLKSGSVESMMQHFERLPLAAIAPMQRDWVSGRFINAGSRTLPLLGFANIPARLPRIVENRLINIPLIAGGRGVLLPASIFEKVGLFDEKNLPHYWADHDFYLRCREQGVPLYIDTGAEVYVDSARTSLAGRLETMRAKDFARSLFDRRSHRNVRDLSAFFKKHHPLPGLHYVAVELNLARYLAVYVTKRLLRLAKSLRRTQRDTP